MFRLQIKTSRLFKKLEDVRERHFYVWLLNTLKKREEKIYVYLLHNSTA
jgi:beta-glucosidase/6-phospho-beta-glucosidase/beta-galactosidase